MGQALFANMPNIIVLSIPFVGRENPKADRSDELTQSPIYTIAYMFGREAYDGGYKVDQIKDGADDRNFANFAGNTSYLPSSLKTLLITNANGIKRNALMNLTTIVNLEINDSINYIYQASMYNMGNLKYIKVPFTGHTLIKDESNPWPSLPSTNYNYGFYTAPGISYYKSFGYFFGECSGSVGDWYRSYYHYENDPYLHNTYWLSNFIPGVERVVLTKETHLYSYAFTNAQKLKSIYLPETLKTIGSNDFPTTNSNTGHVDDLTYNYDGGYNNDSPLIHDSSYEFYGYYRYYRYVSVAFYNCTSLDNLVLPTKLESIGTFTFNRCTSLTSITLPASVTSLGESVFGYCTSLETVRMENKIMGILMFDHCTNLKTVSTAHRFDSIAEQAFTACTALKNFLYDGCGETEGFHLSPNVQIGFQAFNGCTAITNVHIVMEEKTTENGLENAAPYVGTRAFIGCTGIESLIVDGGEIGYNAFVNCTSLETVEIKSGIVGYGAFGYFYYRNNYYLHDYRTQYTKLTNIKTVILGDGVTKIYADAFMGTGITEIVIPASVKSIGSYAFTN